LKVIIFWDVSKDVSNKYMCVQIYKMNKRKEMNKLAQEAKCFFVRQNLF